MTTTRTRTAKTAAATTPAKDRISKDRINKKGARRYNEAASKSARSGTSARKARAAAKALDTGEGKDLRRAERQGKAAKKYPRR